MDDDLDDETVVSIDDLEARLDQAKDLEFQGKFGGSESAATEAIRLSGCLPLGLDRLDRVSALLFEAYSLRGIVRRMQGRRDEAMRDYEEAMDYTINDGQRALTCVNMADIHRGNKEFGRAKESLLEAIGFSYPSPSHLPFPFAYVRAMDQLGLVAVAEQDFDHAIEHYHIAKDTLEQFFAGRVLSRDEAKLNANVYQHLAIAIEYAKREDLYTAAFALHAQALGLSESIRDMSGVLNVVTATARLTAQCGRHHDAWSLYTRAWDVVKDTDYTRGKATVLLHRAISRLHLHDHDIESSLGIEDALGFVRLASSKGVPPGDYKIMAPYVDDLTRLCGEHGVEPQGLADVQRRFHQE